MDAETLDAASTAKRAQAVAMEGGAQLPPTTDTPRRRIGEDRQRKLAETAVRISAYLLVLVGWYVLAEYVVGTEILPTPQRVWEKIVEIFEQDLFWKNFFATMESFLKSFAIGFGLGAVIGVLIGRSNYFDAFFRYGLTVIMGLPGVVIIIVSLMMWGLSPWGRVMAVTLGLIPLVAINVAEGARAVPRDLLDMAASYGVSRRRRIREIVMPATAPFVFTGARFALAVGFKAAAMVEVFGGSSGMGFQLRTQFTRFSVAGVMAWTVLIIVIVIILEIGILKTAERRIFRWRQSAFG